MYAQLELPCPFLQVVYTTTERKKDCKILILDYRKLSLIVKNKMFGNTHNLKSLMQFSIE